MAVQVIRCTSCLSLSRHDSPRDAPSRSGPMEIGRPVQSVSLENKDNHNAVLQAKDTSGSRGGGTR